MNRFEDKNVLITGGTSGFGLDAAIVMASEGARVAVTGHSDNHIEDAKTALPDGSIVLKNDASDPQAAKDLVEAVKAEMGSLDCLWLNAGFGEFVPPQKMDADTFDKLMNTNVRGPVLQMAGLMDMINDGGAVLLTSSVAPYLGQPAGAVYGATKAADLALARAWASALADKNIRVNSVAPGPIETNFLSSMDLPKDKEDEFREQVKSHVPLGRFGESKEVAQVALFLLSDMASYVTGSEYFVDGGMTMR